MNHTHMIQAKQIFTALTVAALAVAVLAFPELAFAQDGSGAKTSVTTFFTNINSLLNVASIAIVTIAVIFAGYQIAFNHKRVGDVAPVLIGGFLIGAAAQIAKMLIPDDPTASAMLIGQMLVQHA
ncbi:TrbC/VirB2 family protein [Pseudoxanthomonas sp.]|jgi:TrbC/VIRB2 family.|uniref:TrbC/VirB2 family protein n=1 Tax=Pseudoxanthomonas sp. TaxID=1871049 RepID=UPI002FE0357F